MGPQLPRRAAVLLRERLQLRPLSGMLSDMTTDSVLSYLTTPRPGNDECTGTAKAHHARTT